MKKIVIATHNKNKLREFGEMLPGWEVVGEDSAAEETETTFVGNARIKARAIAPKYRGSWVLADDSGLSVDALNGAPGVFSARYAGEDGNTPKNNALLLKNLAGVTNRTAHFHCAVVLIDPEGVEHVFEGVCDGRIIDKQMGEGGFGYDPLFVPDGFTKTFAELKPEEKNAISHRGRALRQVIAKIAA